jgi:hypothetical protein
VEELLLLEWEVEVMALIILLLREVIRAQATPLVA